MITNGSRLLRTILGTFRNWFGIIRSEPGAAHDVCELHVAVATLLANIVRVGSGQRPQAWAAAAKALADLCDIDADRAWARLAVAREQAVTDTSYSSRVSVLNNNWSALQKLRFTRQMWRVARANGRISFHQDRLVRRLAEELNVPDADILRTRERFWFH